MQSVQPKNGPGMTVAACLWLGLFPLLQCGTYAHITHDKWVFMLILSGATLLCFLADLCLKRAAFSRRALIPLAVAGVLALWTALSCFCGGSGPETWWLGENARMEGLASQLCYFALFCLFLCSRVKREPVLLAAAAGLVFFGVIVLLQRGGGNPLGLYPAGRSFQRNKEFQGTIGNVDMGTGYLLLLAGLFLYSALERLPILKARGDAPDKAPKSGWELPVAAACVVSFLFAVYLIITMDVQFGAVSLGILAVYTLLRFLPRKWRLPVFVLLVVLVLAVVWFWPGYGGGVWELHEILRGRARLSFGSNRLAVWAFSLRLAGESLLLSGGSGTFAARFNQYIAAHGLAVPSSQDGRTLPSYFDSPHSEYIAQLVDHGLPALLLFAGLLLLSLFRRREGWFPLLSPCSAAVLCYAVQAFFSFSVCIVAPMFWVILALSFRDP